MECRVLTGDEGQTAIALNQERVRARLWLAETGIPFWADRGRDRAFGGFYETVDFDGRGQTDTPKRVRVQARQIYVMSQAHLMGLEGLGDVALLAAEAGFQFMVSRAQNAQGGFAHLLAPDGRVIDAKHDTYDHAFILLALAWYYRATGAAAVKEQIDATMGFLDRALWDGETQSWHEGLPRALPRRQNPHMHLFEAFLALYEATGQGHFLERADAILGLYKSTFFRRDTGTLAEFFDDHWQPIPGADGSWREPGHHFEWVWLLDAYQRLAGEDTTALRTPLWRFATGSGSDPETGLAYDAVRADGKTLRLTKRCWPQTEALKAHLVAMADGERGADRHALHACGNLFDRYLATRVPGLWVDQFGEFDEPLSSVVPASTLYHVVTALAALDRVPQAG